MRDPMSWALPVFRAFGIPVKVHLFFFVVTLGLVLRQMKDMPGIWWVDIVLLTAVIPFVVITLHEFGHCFGARHVGGEAKEILIWPLGGLAYNDVPNHWKANFITTACGPGTNLLICVVCAVFLAIGGFFPTLNPANVPYTCEMHNFMDGREYTSSYGFKIYRLGATSDISASDLHAFIVQNPGLQMTDKVAVQDALAKAGLERALLPGWALWTDRVFWVSWLLLLFNLIPAYPLDGGRMLKELVWWRTTQRQGTTVAAYSGFGVSVLFLIISIALNESLWMGLAMFMLYSAYMALHSLDVEEGPFGYDFSAGYTSLEKDDEPPRRRKRPGYISRWWQARKMRKLQREHEARHREEERMDQLLDKIARTGKDSLTEEERRFLEHASTRYRNRS